MPTLRGTLDVFGEQPAQPCRWCGEPTLTLLVPEGSTRAPIPLHAVCGAEFIVAYRDIAAGRSLSVETGERVQRIVEGAPHRWSGWPGAWCLDCGIGDPGEACVAMHDDRCTRPECRPGICPEPGSRRHDPYNPATP